MDKVYRSGHEKASGEACYVYIMRAGDRVKIGVSKDPEKRRRQIEQRQAPYDVELFYAQLFSSRRAALDCEAGAHRSFRGQRVRGEWFLLDDSEARGLVASLQAVAAETYAPLQESDLRAIDALAYNATPGPWAAANRGDSVASRIEIRGYAVDHVDPLVAGCAVDGGGWASDGGDARYISRMDPFTAMRMVAEIRRLRAEVAELKGAE